MILSNQNFLLSMFPDFPRLILLGKYGRKIG
jgi:chitinase